MMEKMPDYGSSFSMRAESGKEIQTSKNSTRTTMATPLYPDRFIASMEVTMTPMKRTKRIRRGLTIRQPSADRSLPTVKAV